MKKDLKRIIAKNLRKYNRGNAYTLSYETGVSHQTINKILDMEYYPRVTTLVKLAKGLGIDVEDFFR